MCMILDEEVRQLFQDKLAKQGHYGGDPTSLQIFRGVSALRWKGQHSAGCFRHFTVFNNFGAIPKYCFDCCKVLIAPRTVVELFKLLMVFEKLDLPNDNTRKCMCENRDFCSGAYKGFVYCRGVDEAEAVAEHVRKLVAEAISPNILVSIKRGCSEFERAYPGFDRVAPIAAAMKYNNDWKVHEDFVDRNAVFNSANTPVGAGAPYGPAEIFATHYWLSYAATIGDMSYQTITGCAIPSIPQLRRPPFIDATATV